MLSLNIEEEEYWEACQHALKNPYEARTDDENNEGGEAPSDDDEGSGSKDDNSGDSNSDDGGDSDGRDNSNGDSDSERSNSEDYDSQDNGMIGVNPLVIERTKMREPSMKTILMTMWTNMMET